MNVETRKIRKLLEGMLDSANKCAIDSNGADAVSVGRLYLKGAGLVSTTGRYHHYLNYRNIVWDKCYWMARGKTKMA